MKKISLIIILTILNFISFSQIRTASQAEVLCNEWIQSLYPEKGLTIVDYQTFEENSEPVYYIFNLSQQGFILVSAEQRTKAILGYSTENNWNYQDEKPPALIDLLNWYTDQIVYIRTENLQIPVYEFNPSENTTNVLPLLTTSWGQGEYYNAQCPGTHTGCVATAMGQIMNYHEQPIHGFGSNTYYWRETISADFHSTNYDWNNMPTELNELST